MTDVLVTAAGYAAAAWLLMAEERAMRAVASVEAGSLGAFLETGEPTILYERHLFHRLTGGAFSGAKLEDAKVEPWACLLSSPTPGGYGPVSIQHEKLAAAVKLDRDAALKSCSWGLFQILGLNHVEAGYLRLQRFIDAMYRSADDHLRAFTMFIRNNDRLVDALRAKDWRAFALTYNGPAFQKNQYAEKLAAAYEKLGAAA